jgi:hypothetical protein
LADGAAPLRLISMSIATLLAKTACEAMSGLAAQITVLLPITSIRRRVGIARSRCCILFNI